MRIFILTMRLAKLLIISSHLYITVSKETVISNKKADRAWLWFDSGLSPPKLIAGA
jgi:hypothetical protein